LENGEILLCDDSILTRQLATRYYKLTNGVVYQLLSKIEMRNRGLVSPDRADAGVMAFADYKSTFVGVLDSDEHKEPFEVEEPKTKIVGSFDLRVSAEGGGPKNLNRLYNVNNGQQYFGDLEQQIADYNKQLLLTKELVND
jgi:hypothetical protein